MKLTALVCLLLLIATIFGNENEKESEVKDYAKVSAPAGKNVVFAEVFDDTWSDRWFISANPDFKGEWKVEEGIEPYGTKGDKGLVVSSKARKHAIAARFSKVLDNTNKDLVIQYEVRLQNNLDCGGAYIKLLSAATLPADLSDFDNDTPYTVMFGPDKCGSTNKVHFIIRHKNPKTGEIEEKHLKSPPSIQTGTQTHLYTLVIQTDNSFEIFIDQELKSSGNLLEDFLPAFNPPKEIDDPNDLKPADWVDESEIPDPTAVKPEDWDENEPGSIVDENDEKPENWLDNEPLEIPDPEAEKPNDWDDELDGEWDSPLVRNPKCDEVGCGIWKPRLIPNPKYKGKWYPPLIENPAYKGEWKPKQIPNPNYFEDKHPHNLEKIGGIGFEIWTMSEGIMFDNVIVTFDKSVADEFAEATWVKKHADEEAIKATEEKENGIFSQGTSMISEFFGNAIEYAADPENLLVVIGTLVAAILVPILLCFLLPGSRGSSKKAKPVEKKPEKVPKSTKKEKEVTTKEEVSGGKEQKATKRKRVKD